MSLEEAESAAQRNLYEWELASSYDTCNTITPSPASVTRVLDTLPIYNAGHRGQHMLQSVSVVRSRQPRPHYLSSHPSIVAFPPTSRPPFVRGGKKEGIKREAWEEFRFRNKEREGKA